MVNYYEILKVSRKATGAEIKSAYRRLARKLHPDRNNGRKDTVHKFAAIVEAYEVLGNAAERVKYDRLLVDAKYLNQANNNTFFQSANPHARRWQKMVFDKRYNDIIDRMAAEERKEAMAFQKVVFPAAALFISAVLTTALKPVIFANTAIIGEIIIVALFIVSLIHLSGRVRDGFDRYTETSDGIHESILDENERTTKRFPRVPAAAALVGALVFCLTTGFLIGTQMMFAADSLPMAFGHELTAEFVFYPPIVALFVDIVHSIVSRL